MSSLIQDISGKRGKLARFDPFQLLISLDGQPVRNLLLPTEELDHAQDTEHYGTVMSAEITIDVNSDDILSVTVCTRASVFFIAVS